MIPRKKLDLGYGDLLFGFSRCLISADRRSTERRIGSLFGSPESSVCFLSVRSGFDLVLQKLNWPKGSQVLVSAITISDMPRILVEHGLVPVPIDLDAEDLSLQPALLEKWLGPQTKGVLFAHLFGTTIDLSPLVAVCRRHGLFLFEDCAQAYRGNGFTGSPGCDVSMFSFGPIKACSALGGAVFQFQDTALAASCRAHQERHYKKQPRRQFFLRLTKYLGLKIFSHRPVFTLAAWGFRLASKDFDRTLSLALKSFPGPDLLARLRHRLSDAQLALLEHKLRTFDPGFLLRRSLRARYFRRLLPDLRVLGDPATHSYWVFPIQADDPEGLGSRLRRLGFDVTTQASNMRVVSGAAENPPRASGMLDRLLYLPVYPGVSHRSLKRLARELS